MGSSSRYLVHGIRRLMLMHGAGHQLQWTKADPERIKPRMDWTADDQGIYMADLVAGKLNILHGEVAITSYVADADELLASLVPDVQWVWMADNRIFTGSLRHRVQCYHYQQYVNRRDTKRIHQNTPSRWTQYSSGLMSALTNAKKRRSARTRGRLVNHLLHWMAHEANLAKDCSGTMPHVWTVHHYSAFPCHTTNATMESSGTPHADAIFGMAHMLLQSTNPPQASAAL